jgi:hypothetical protein
MPVDSLKLSSFSYAEWVADRLNWEMNDVVLGDFALLLGDNAQGKTRLFNILRTFCGLHLGKKQIRNPHYRGEASFHFSRRGVSVQYQVRVEGGRDPTSRSGLAFHEKITADGDVVFDRDAGVLVDEQTGDKIEKFFVPGDAPAVSAIRGEGHPTCESVNSFFRRMLFLQANRFAADEYHIDASATVLDEKGANVASVLHNWKDRYPGAYKEVQEAFRDCFPWVGQFEAAQKPIGKQPVPIPILVMRPHDSERVIDQPEWSDGLIRATCLFAMPCTQLQEEGSKEIIRPSFVGVDEVENGLDFNTLTKVIEHLRAHSNLFQVVASSHAPVVCNLTDPREWLVARRSGVTVRITPPGTAKEINDERRRLRNDNWEFYKRNVARNRLRSIK